MSDTNDSAAADSKRKRVSERRFLNAAGEKSVGPVADGSVQYILLGSDGKTALKSWTLDGSSPGLAQLAMFGFVTKVGNVANSVLNADEPGTPEEAAEEIDAFIAGLADGTWREAATGASRGPKYDKDVLASALIAELGEKAKGDVAHYRERLDDKSYYAKVRANTAIMARYMTMMKDRAAEAPTADSLA